jgi:ABC-2 type transport system ATP-binding protein
MLEVTDLRKRYGDVAALRGMSLAVAAGEIVGLIGHNGAGKSTLAEVILGLVRPDAGTVEVGGIDALADPRRARRRIGVSPQELALYLPATARENLELFAGLAGLRHRAVRRAVDAILEELELGVVAGKQIRQLSGGQQRRVQAGCALLGRPSLLLLDEPTVGADPLTRQMVLAAVRRRADAGAAVLYTTHYLPELVDLDATIAVARAGRIVARGNQEQLLAGLPGEVRLRFDEVPDTDVPGAERVGDELRITGPNPASTLPKVLADLANDNVLPSAVEVRKPDLDDLYRSLDRVEATT